MSAAEADPEPGQASLASHASLARSRPGGRGIDLENGGSTAAASDAALSVAAVDETGSDSNDNDLGPTKPAGNGKIAGKRTKAKFKPDSRFWMIMVGLSTICFLASLENTIIATALPLIVTDLNVGKDYVWIGNAFFLTRYAAKIHSSQFAPPSPLHITTPGSP